MSAYSGHPQIACDELGLPIGSAYRSAALQVLPLYSNRCEARL